MNRRSWLATLGLTLCFPLLAATAAPSPTGYWLVQDGSAVVRIEESGDRLSGRTVWMKDPKGPDGKPLLDELNPDPTKRGRKRLGLPILFGFSPPDAKGVCEGGQVYNPRDGKTYSGTITLIGKDRLELRGYVLVTLIGKTQTWTRVEPAKYGL